MKKWSLVMLVTILCTPTFGRVVVDAGDTEKEVLQRNPSVLGSRMMKGKKMLVYSDARVFLEDGVVVSFDGNALSKEALKQEAEKKETDEQKRKEFQQKQRDLGLVFYCGSWVAPEAKKKAELNKEEVRREKAAQRRAKLLERRTALLKHKVRTQTFIRLMQNSGRRTIVYELALADIDVELIDIASALEKLR